MKNKGLIIIGYQGIGKSSYASARNNTIDLESSNFKVNGERADNWYEIYCLIAISLAKQGYIVFTSSHRVVTEEFMRRHNTNDNYVIVVVTPSSNLEDEWVEKLRQRWLKDQSNDKNFIAYKDANENFQNEVIWLASQNVFPYIPILSTDYLFSNIVNGICKIYGIRGTVYTNMHKNYDKD